ncbi:MAG TPA: BatA domain-containing protein [Bacteroidota bacterium]|nr:BatA domain-containing protein [Bacteroidota bacterium]
MTFLNPLVLFGLAAAAIPVVLHLLNLRKLRTIEFSTLTFLKELQQSRIRRLKIRQLLLLLIRTLIILALVLAFARPALKGALFGTIGASAKSTVVFILDDSFSMAASDQGGEYFKQAKERTEKLIDVLNAGDEVYLIRMSDLPKATIDPATHDFSTLRSVIRESNISNVRRPLDSALALATKLLGKSQNANKEVYVISDMQQTLFGAAQKSTAAKYFGSTVRVFLVNIGARSADNVAVDSVAVLSKIVEKNKPLEIYASVRNYSNQPLSNYVLSVFLDNARAAQQSMRIEPDGSASVVLTVTPKRSGYIEGYVELENDPIEQDNRRYFTVFIPDRINVAMISSDSSDAHYVALALDAGNSADQAALVNVAQFAPDKFPLIDPKSYDAMIVIGANGLLPNAVARIKEFVEQGGGLVLFPGSKYTPAEFNTGLLPALSIPDAGSVIGGGGAQTSVSFRQVDLDHPLFASMFDLPQKGKLQNEGIESPTITSVVQRQSGREGHTIVSLTDGTPFLSEHRLGRGKILFYSVAPVLSWSDFPVRGIFVPMIFRSVVYASSSAIESQSAVVGSDLFLTAKARPAGGGESASMQYTLYSPDSSQERILPAASIPENGSDGAKPDLVSNRQNGALTFVKPHIAVPGFYLLKQGRDTLGVASVNIDQKESDTRKIAESDLLDVAHTWGGYVKVVPATDQPAELQTVVLQSRFGVELWKYLVLLALLLILAEMLLARDNAKEASAVSVA